VGKRRRAAHNLLCVLRGRKTVALLSPQDSATLRPAPLASVSSHHAGVQLLDDEGRVAALPGGVVPLLAVVDAGSGLFIPEGWWHSVVSEPRTVAVNFWWPGVGARISSSLAMANYAARTALAALAGQRLQREREACVAAAVRAELLPEGKGRDLPPVLPPAIAAAVRSLLLATPASSLSAQLYDRADLTHALAVAAESVGPQPISYEAAAVDTVAAAMVDSVALLPPASGGVAERCLQLLPAQAAYDVLSAALKRAAPTGDGTDGEGRAAARRVWRQWHFFADATLDILAARWEATPPQERGDASAAEAAFAALWEAINDARPAAAAVPACFPGRLLEARERLQRAALRQVLSELCGEEAT
jgi:hypothetical protein